MKKTLAVYCRICGREMAYDRRGRPRAFCSRNCRTLAQLARAYFAGPVALGVGGKVRQPAESH